MREPSRHGADREHGRFGKLKRRLRWRLQGGGRGNEWLERLNDAEGLDLDTRAPDDCEILAPGDLYWEAFWALCGDRAPPGLGPPGSIPWLAIDAYARRAGVPEDEFTAFANAVRELDAEYLKVLSEQLAKG